MDASELCDTEVYIPCPTSKFLFVDMFACIPQGRMKRKDAEENETGEATRELMKLIEIPEYL